MLHQNAEREDLWMLLLNSWLGNFLLVVFLAKWRITVELFAYSFALLNLLETFLFQS